MCQVMPLSGGAVGVQEATLDECGGAAVPAEEAVDDRLQCGRGADAGECIDVGCGDAGVSAPALQYVSRGATSGALMTGCTVSRSWSIRSGSRGGAAVRTTPPTRLHGREQRRYTDGSAMLLASAGGV